MRIALVSYLNTRPFLDGLNKTLSAGDTEYLLLPPAQCARALQNDEASLALLPVGSIPDFERLQLLPGYCIGANGPVGSVLILSERPIEQVEKLLLDRHSRSSNLLAQVLLQRLWKREIPCNLPDVANFSAISGTTAGVVIGDQAMRMRDQFPYQYDLSTAWKQLTGLPFVFAVWACKPGSLSPEQLQGVHKGLRSGVAAAASSGARWAGEFGFSADFAAHYLTHHIDFRFDQAKHKALGLYLELAAPVGQQAVRQEAG